MKHTCPNCGTELNPAQMLARLKRGSRYNLTKEERARRREQMKLNREKGMAKEENVRP